MLRRRLFDKFTKDFYRAEADKEKDNIFSAATIWCQFQKEVYIDTKKCVYNCYSICGFIIISYKAN